MSISMDCLFQDSSLDSSNLFDDLFSFDIPSIQIEEQQGEEHVDASPDSAVVSSSIDDIEKFLMEEEMNENYGEELVDDDGFFTSLFVQDDIEEPKADMPVVVDAVSGGSQKENDNDGDGDENGEGDDPLSKKRKRQMRNREAAMKSRERKKEYVKELEMKNKYLEQECRRLDYALRCCAAENLVLRQRLHFEASAAAGGGASAAKQESAVLFKESLLLGSLFVLLSVIFLFLMPNLDHQNLVCRSIVARSVGKEVVVGRKMVDKREQTLYLSFLMKRCRGMRTRMKFFLLPPCAVSA